MQRTPRPTSDVRNNYLFRIQLSLAISLLLVIGAFRAALPSGPGSLEIISERLEVVHLEEIEQTRHQLPPPPAPTPPPPIEVPDERVTEDVTLDLDFELDLTQRVAPPPPPAPASPPAPPPPTEPEIFTIVEQPPVLIGGLAEVQRRVRYPEIARQAGISGVVHVQFVIDEEGRVTDPVCLRDPGGGTCEAAIAAVRDARFEPGRQRGRVVRVRYAMPIRFQLQ